MDLIATIQSPDGRYSIEQHDDFGEIGMGSPQFGHVTIHGTEGQLPDKLYGKTVLFSPDSRFVALEELMETRPFRTKLIVAELPRCRIYTVHAQPQGTATPARWDGPTRLIYMTWSVGAARESSSWDAPPPNPDDAGWHGSGVEITGVAGDTATSGQIRKRGLKRFVIGGAAYLAILFVMFWFGQFVHMFGHLAFIAACFPFAIACAGLIELVSGRPYTKLAQSWMNLQPWQRGVLGTIIILGSLFLIGTVVTFFVMTFG